MTQPNSSLSAKGAGQDNTRQAAALAIYQILWKNQFPESALNAAFSQYHLAQRDRALCTELVLGTLCWQAPLHTSLKRTLQKPGKPLEPKLLSHLLIAAYQLQHLSERIPAYAAIYHGVENIKRQRKGLDKLANAILRRLGCPLHLSLPPELTPHLLSQAFGLPLPLLLAITSLFPPAAWRQAALSFNERPKLWARFYGDATLNASWIEQLALQEIQATLHPFVPDALCLDHVCGIAALPGFMQGQFFIQDPASQIAALLCAPKLGDEVIDCCAAPGGKAVLLKSMTGPKGRVQCFETNPRKKALLEENSQRMKLGLDIHIKDARTIKDQPSLKESADVVLVDAPCSGLGTLRRHPEIKLKYQALEDLNSLITLQQELLASAATAVKPGGCLVYSVCSPLPDEGSKQINTFLASHPQFKRQDAQNYLPWLPQSALTDHKEVLLWPHLHQSDGFFAARLYKDYP